MKAITSHCHLCKSEYRVDAECSKVRPGEPAASQTGVYIEGILVVLTVNQELCPICYESTVDAATIMLRLRGVPGFISFIEPCDECEGDVK